MSSRPPVEMITCIRHDRRLQANQRRLGFARGDRAVRATDGTVPEVWSNGRDITERNEEDCDQHPAALSGIGRLRRRRRNFRHAVARELLAAASGSATGAVRAVAAGRAQLTRPAGLQDNPAFQGEKVNVTCQPFEPRRLVAGAVSALADEASSPGCGIASVIAADVPQCVSGDPALFRQMIERLAGPALGDGNGICIRISAEAGRLRLFFETPWPRVPGKGGKSGDLPLAAVRPVIEAMRGEVAVHHSNGAASVWVEIPAPAAGETAGDAERGAAGSRSSPGTLSADD